jgi:hypothetical protein
LPSDVWAQGSFPCELVTTASNLQPTQWANRAHDFSTASSGAANKRLTSHSAPQLKNKANVEVMLRGNASVASCSSGAILRTMTSQRTMQANQHEQF